MSDDFSELPDLVAKAHRCYRESRRMTTEWRIEARNNYDMLAGRQWDEADRKQMEDQERVPVVFDRIGRTVNAIIGTQIANRQDTQFLPRELGDVQTNEILTGAADWARQQCDAEDEETDAFEDMCISGMGWTDTRMDYDNEPDGMLVIERSDPLTKYWDPSARKHNLADAKWILDLQSMSVSEFSVRWPDAEITSLSDPWDGTDNEDMNVREHVYAQDAYNEQRSNSKGKTSQIRVGRYQWAEPEKVYRVGAGATELTAGQYRKLKKRILDSGIQVVPQTRYKWKQAFIACGQVLESEDCPFPDGPTLRCMTYKRDRNKNTWYGIVRPMVDPQKFGNKFFSQILDILNKGAKGGVMMEKDAVDNAAEIEEKWARPDGIIFLRPGAIAGGKVQAKPVVTLPPGLDRLMTFSLDSVHEITGINLELLGMANREQPGVLEHQRKQAGITIIAPLFDAMRRYRKEQGRVLLYFIQNYLSDGRLIRITGEQNQQYVPLIKQPGVAEYDVVVDESPTSPNMKERVFGIMSDLLPSIAKMGLPIPPDVLDYSPLPAALVAKWKDLIQKSGGNPQQMQQQMAQMQQQLQQLSQENAQLKDKRDQAAMQMQMDRQQAMADMDIEKQKMALEWEKAQAEIAIDKQKLEIEKQKAAWQLQIEDAKAAQDIELGRKRVDGELDLKAKQSAGGIDEAIQRHSKSLSYLFKDGKSKFSIERDGNGEISSAVVEGPNGKRRLTVHRGPNGEFLGGETSDEAA